MVYLCVGFKETALKAPKSLFHTDSHEWYNAKSIELYHFYAYKE
ncbi:hypothetical protein MCU_00326 [Bartonella elizabethae Re6043vi]|uniref:Uncharacterized protein n=2 Tax=Bartonella elizabethae TaxID=807 RepID=J1A2J6_BAREL|nr:hypothetical protein MCU_00326 [Bartonella elizabethae Re6043vi]EJF95818.1 hypothetical protein MEE_01055 [Bartonella elizabethae F9251 = ATCC 49927]VEJ41207.1 Uncharacterised protein [Bartonella elizabethae]